MKMERAARLRKYAKLLCPECGVMKTWVDVSEDGAILECGHHRTTGLLDPHKGYLSIEAVIAGDPLALALFKAVDHDGFKQKGKDLSDVIGDADRELWSLAA
jgi:hypothetical protein